ncbi:MAG TPA: hypothetical protein VE444_04655 [Gaiellaceae bacterium]|nr:hypothetical protein [Gaiellaceae bacterium]
MSRTRRQRQRAGLASRVAAVVLAFVLGLVIGVALDDAPEPQTTTYERTLRFATVTVTAP